MAAQEETRFPTGLEQHRCAWPEPERRGAAHRINKASSRRPLRRDGSRLRRGTSRGPSGVDIHLAKTSSASTTFPVPRLRRFEFRGRDAPIRLQSQAGVGEAEQAVAPRGPRIRIWTSARRSSSTTVTSPPSSPRHRMSPA
jgi:hypothetical protein